MVSKNKVINCLIPAFLTSETTNVIIVDWEVAASSILAANYARGVADNVIELVRLLTVHNKINRASLHLVGFGLAAHIVGFAARQYVNDSPVARITGEFWVFFLWIQFYKKYIYSYS